MDNLNENQMHSLIQSQYKQTLMYLINCKYQILINHISSFQVFECKMLRFDTYTKLNNLFNTYQHIYNQYTPSISLPVFRSLIALLTAMRSQIMLFTAIPGNQC